MPPASTARSRMVPVIETGRSLRVFFEVERSIVSSLSTLIPRAPRLEVKYGLCEHVWEAAQHARFLRERGRELAGFGADEAVRLEIAHVFDEAIRGPDWRATLAAFAVLKRGLRDAYQSYLDAAEPLADWPTCNLIRDFVADEERQAVELEAWLEGAPAAPFAAHVEEAYAARGGWVGEVQPRPLPPGFAWARDAGPYAHPPLPDRGDAPICAGAIGEDPAEFPVVRAWLTDPATDPRVIRIMIYVWLMGEADAVDYLPTIFHDTPDAPFDYHYDLARHTWDESRHSQFGYRQLPKLGVDLATLEQQIVLYDVLVRMAPHERYVMVTWYFEAGSFDIKAEVMDRVGELGDFEADTLLAFDRSDEQNHVRFGHRWLPTLLELYGDERDARTFAEETAKRFSELNAEATARIGHGLPASERLTAHRILEIVGRS